MYKKDVTVTNKTGLHARPASEFAKTATRFKSDINILCKGKAANAKSILNILAAGINAGTALTISADGPDEKEAVDTLVRLVESRFGE